MRPRTVCPMLLLLVLLVLLVPLGAGPARTDEGPSDEAKRVPCLWVVEGETPLFLFGTTTLPDDRLQHLPPVVENALEESDVFVSEAPLDLASQMKVQMGMRLPGGKTLVSVVGEDTYARVKKVMPAGIPEMLYRQFSPLAVASLLELRDYAKAVMQGKLPVEAKLHTRFTKAGKKTVALETVTEQLATFQAITLEEQATLLEGLVSRVEREIESGKGTAETVVALYLAGEVEELAALIRQPTTDDPDLEAKFARILLDERQARMVERLDRMRRDAPDAVHFVALGVGHLGGKTGLLKRFEKAGWTLHRVADAEDLPAPRKEAAAGR